MMTTEWLLHFKKLDQNQARTRTGCSASSNP